MWSTQFHRIDHDPNNPYHNIGIGLRDLNKETHDYIKDTLNAGERVFLRSPQQEEMTMRNATDIIMVLDRSGSMADVKQEMDEVLGGYIYNQQQQPGECTFSLYQFNTNYETVMENVPIKNVGKVTLEPSGGTALLDALGQAIDRTGARIRNMPEWQRPNKVLFVVITDGEENSSREYINKGSGNKAQRINDMVSHQRDVYKWEFIFLGADQDAITNAAGLGFSGKLSTSYSNTSRGVKGMGARLTKMSNTYRMSPSAAVGTMSMEAEQKTSGGIVTPQETMEWDAMIAAQKAQQAIDPNATIGPGGNTTWQSLKGAKTPVA